MWVGRKPFKSNSWRKVQTADLQVDALSADAGAGRGLQSRSVLILAICSNLFQTSGPDRPMEPMELMEMEVKKVKTELPDVDRTQTAEVAEPVVPVVAEATPPVPVVAPLDTELEAKAAKPGRRGNVTKSCQSLGSVDVKLGQYVQIFSVCCQVVNVSEEHASHSACVSELTTAPPREGTQPRPRPQPVAATGWTRWTRRTAATAERATQPQENTGSRRSCSILQIYQNSNFK